MDLPSANRMASVGGRLRLATRSARPPAFLRILMSSARTPGIPARERASTTSSISTHSGMPSNRTGVLTAGSLTLAASPATVLILSARRSALSAPSTSRRIPPALVLLVVTTLTPMDSRLTFDEILFIVAARDAPSEGRSIITAAVLGILLRSNEILLAVVSGFRTGGLS